MDKNGYTKKAIIAGVILAVAIVLYFILYNPERVAILHFDAGKVYVNEKPVLEDVKLKKGDIIKTAEDGQATVILYNSVIVMLEPNTIIKLEDLTKKNPKIEQTEGKTWNKFIKVAGVEEYTVKSGNSIASVRGTFFGIEDDKIIVSEGEVEYAVDGEVFFVTENEVVEETDKGVIERAVEEKESEEIKEALPEAVEELNYLAELVSEEQESSDKEIATEEKMNENNTIIEKINAEIQETKEEIAEGSKEEINSTIEETANENPVVVESNINETTLDTEITSTNTTSDNLLQQTMKL